WIHHNHGPGIWADTNNNDFLIEGNLIEANDSQAIFYEISYNATIRDNVLRNNTWREGRDFADENDPFPVGTVYLSEAGGEPRIPARTSVLEVTGNVFDNNWGGVAGWENADRFCGTNTTSDCTLLVGENDGARCRQPGIAEPPLYDDCRWRTQRLRIHHNTFTVNTAHVDGGCEPTFCATQSLFANVGTWPDWSPYQGRRVQEAITFGQDNRWHDNTYRGRWRWVAYEPGRYLTFAQWQADPYGQDQGSG
ncbi:MAG: right-handed parallel beta-helix repeat-containing protein, partial [Thermocrispum sp.]